MAVGPLSGYLAGSSLLRWFGSFAILEGRLTSAALGSGPIRTGGAFRLSRLFLVSGLTPAQVASSHSLRLCLPAVLVGLKYSIGLLIMKVKLFLTFY